VGDAESDVAMARSCDISVAVVLSGALDRRGAQELGVTWVLPALSVLPEFLQSNVWPPAD
jgi:phosphoglycolate phosphatase-like HAD superfamily hydrolase